LCKPKSGDRTTTRPPLTRLTGKVADRLARKLHIEQNEIYRAVEISDVGLKLGLGDSRSWLPWELFEITKQAHALPNHFLAFAPNDRSYHAVSMDLAEDAKRRERPVVRGFIRSGANTRNWVEVMM
jgi:hypothetical protein